MGKGPSQSLCRHLLSVAVLAVCFPAASPSAQGNIVLDFESAASSTKMYAGISNEYSSFGFKLESAAFGSWGTSSANFAGSTALFNLFDNDTTVLSRTDGGVFDLYSIDLSEAFRGGRSTTVDFVGTRVDGTQVVESVAMDGIFGFESFNFSSLSGVTSVFWSQGSSYHQFDNVALGLMGDPNPGGGAVAPVPPAFLLGAFGLALAGLFKRRQSGTA